MKTIWNWMKSILHKIISFFFRLIGKELSDQTFQSLMEFVKFGIVGVSNTIISYVIYAVSLLAFRKYFDIPKFDYYIAQGIAFVLSVLWSFYWNNKLVFVLKKGEKRVWWKALLKTYVSYSFTGLFLNSILLYVWVDMLGISAFIAPIINLLVSVPLNFIINKFWAFKQDKKEKTTEKKNNKVYVWYLIFCVVMSAVIFGQVFLYGKTLLWNVDGYLQWNVLMGRMKEIIISIFSGKGVALWDWSIGLGSDMISSFACIVFDPFTYIAVFFSKNYMDIAYTVIVIVKLFAAGATMLVYLRYHKKKEGICLIGAISYAFCAWGITCTRHEFFLTQLIIFPLLILGIDKVEDKKSPLTLIATIFWTLIQSVYFTYMSAIFVAIYLVAKWMLSEKKVTAKYVMGQIGKYIVYIGAALMMSAALMLPSLYALINASKGSGVTIGILPTIKDWLRFVPSFLSTLDAAENYSIIGMNALMIAMIPAIVYFAKRKKVMSWMVIICSLFFLIPALQSVTNGFSYASGRWSYIMNFFLVVAAIECLESPVVRKGKYGKLAILMFVVGEAVTIVAATMFNAFGVGNLVVAIINGIFGVGFCVMLHSKSFLKKYGKKALLYAVALNCMVMGYCYYNPQVGTVIHVLMDQGESARIYNNNSLKVVSEINNKEFYRVDTVDYPTNEGEAANFTHTPANTSLYWNVPTLSEYLSTLDSNWLEYNKLLGNSSGVFRRMCSYSNDNRARMDYLAGVKYFVSKDNLNPDSTIWQSAYRGYDFEAKKSTDGISTFKNKQKVSLGYVYDHYVTDGQLEDCSYLQREQLLMQGALVEYDDQPQLKNTTALKKEEVQWEQSKPVLYEIKLPEDEVIRDENGLVVKNVCESQKNAFVFNRKGHLNIELEEQVGQCELYVLLKNFKRIPFTKEEEWEAQQLGTDQAENKISKRNHKLSYMSEEPYGNLGVEFEYGHIKKRIVNAEGEPQGIRDLSDYVVNLGYVRQNDNQITCYFDKTGKYTYDSIEIVAVPLTNYEQQAQKLSANRLKVKGQSNSRISGTVNTEKGGLLYLSILYNKGWKIYIDGKETKDIYRVNKAFTGVEVPAGKHKIVLQYRPIGMPYSIYIGIFGLVLTIVCHLLWKRQAKKSDEKESE